MLKKGVVSIEFLLSLLIIIMILFLFITININFKNKLTTEINYKKYNYIACFLKQQIIEEYNGEVLNDPCKKNKSTNNGS